MAWISDLNWLPTSLLKGIKAPRIIYNPDYEINCSGCYHKGLIIIKECDDDPDYIIAHEFQHYLQDLAGLLPSNPTSWQETYETSGCNYDLAIQKYFTENWHEYDALRFEYKVAKNEVNETWWRTCNYIKNY